MTRSEDEIHTECMQRFVELANSMKEEGIDIRVVSAGMLTASAVYSTYALAGNDGRLAPAGIAKLTEGFRQQLEQVQQVKAEKRKKA